ncbi:MAG: RDD family protein [Bacilli bacterium]
MKASLGKRASAYLIDLIVIIIILSLVSLIYHPDVSSLNANMDNITVEYANKDITFTEYITELSSIYKQMDITNIFLNLINVLIIIIYFIIYPYLNDGKTIGKKLMHIEVRNQSNRSYSLVQFVKPSHKWVVVFIICYYLFFNSSRKSLFWNHYCFRYYPNWAFINQYYYGFIP